MRKIWIVLLLALCCASLTIGCAQKNDSSTSDSSSGGNAAFVNIIDSAVTLDCFDDYSLIAESSAEGAVLWSSSDPSVVSVDENGLISSGIKLGTAKITARVGDVSDECAVTVLLKNGIPEMRSENRVFVSENESYEIPFTVYYNGNDISEYLSFGLNPVGGDNNVATASINANVVTFNGVSEGVSAFVVYTYAFDRLYAEKVDVTVFNTDIAYIVNGAVNSQLQLRSDNECFTSDIEVYYKNERVSDETLDWTIANEYIVSIGSNGKLVGNMEGVTTISAEYRGETIGVEVKVIKDRENITVSQEKPLDVNLDINISVDTVNKTRTYAANETNTVSLKVGNNTDAGIVVRGYVDGEALNVEGFSFANGVVSIPTKAFGSKLYGEKTLVLEVEDSDVVRIYTLNVLLITKIPTSLNAFQTAIVIRWPGDRITGYYVLDRDIDFSSYEISVYATDWNWDNGFRGTLDGRNYSLLNMRSVMYGITAQIGEGGVFKNLKMPNFKYNGTNTTLFARGAAGATFENIEITLNADSSCDASTNIKDAGLLISHDMRRNTFRNITINAAGKDLQKIFGGTGNEKGSCIYENVTIRAKSVQYYENDEKTAPNGVTIITTN